MLTAGAHQREPATFLPHTARAFGEVSKLPIHFFESLWAATFCLHTKGISHLSCFKYSECHSGHCKSFSLIPLEAVPFAFPKNPLTHGLRFYGFGLAHKNKKLQNPTAIRFILQKNKPFEVPLFEPGPDFLCKPTLLGKLYKRIYQHQK